MTSIVRDFINEYKNGSFYSNSEKNELFEYLDFIDERASGKIMTGAQYLRNFALNHKLYENDSNISEALCREIVDRVDDIVHGKIKAPRLLGDKIDIANRRKSKLSIDIPKTNKILMEQDATSLSLPDSSPNASNASSTDSIRMLLGGSKQDTTSSKGVQLEIEVGTDGGGATNTIGNGNKDDKKNKYENKPRYCCSRLFGWFS